MENKIKPKPLQTAWADEWLKDKQFENATLKTYMEAVKKFFFYMAKNGITNPQREDFLSWINELKADGKKPTTTQIYVTATKLFFAWLSEKQYCKNICKRIKNVKVDNSIHKKDYLSISAVKRCIHNIDTTTLKGKRDYAIFTLFVTCGLRTIEGVRANVEDLQTKGGVKVLTVQGKGHGEKDEFVKIPEQVENAIMDYLQARGSVEPSEPLFESVSNSDKGERMTTRSISRICKNCMINAGYDNDRLTAHSLRHTAVTMAIKHNCTLTQAIQLTRCNLESTTRYYIDIAVEENRYSPQWEKNNCSDSNAKSIFKGD